LRILTRNDIDRHSRKIDERGDTAGARGRLLGGAAVWGEKPQ
jgi:hypothetical protein